MREREDTRAVGDNECDGEETDIVYVEEVELWGRDEACDEKEQYFCVERLQHSVK